MLANLNMNSLLVFKEVFHTKSMTKAAKHLSLTQPGVSQHIATLEQTLELELFIRENRTLIPSRAGRELYELLDGHLGDIDRKLMEIMDNKTLIKGQVKLGLPIEFGNNIVFPILAKLKIKFPGISFQIFYGLGPTMNEKLLSGKIDFAFVDEIISSPYLQYKTVYREELVLCCKNSYLSDVKIKGKLKKQIPFELYEYAAYLSDQSILQGWFKKAMGLKKTNLKILLQTGDAQGIFSFIKEGMGLGVVPKHMLKTVDESDYTVFTNTKEKVLNGIQLAFNKQRAEHPLLKHILDEFKLEFSIK